MRPAESYDSNAEAKERDHRKTIKQLLKYLWPKDGSGFRLRIILSLLCLVLAKALNAVVPIIYKYLVDALSIENPVLAIPLLLIFAYGAARIGQSFFGELRDFLFVKVSQRTRRKIALETFKHLHSLSLKFHLERQTGGISRVIERGTRAIRFVLSFVVFNIGPTIFELLMVISILVYWFDISYGIVIALSVISYILLTVKVTEWRLKFRREMNIQDSTANTKAVDSLLNFETVKYFNNEEYEYKRYDEALAGFEKANIDSQGSLLLLNVGQQAVIGLGTIAVLYLAAKNLVEGSMTIGDFVMINTYMMQLFLPLNFLGFVYREIKQGLIDMDKMFELLDVEAEVKDLDNAQQLKTESPKIQFKNVSFHYNDDRPIIKDLSFTVNPGETLAIVGKSGAGKSTISRLLMRFYDINEGSITIDGIDIRHVTQKSLRSTIGIVPQDTVLFNDTIAYNIKYADPQCSEASLHESADHAQIGPFIKSLKDQFETKVGERGLKLSGGEKQRVSIARAILKNPKILILDEATSSLDSKTEREIQSSLDQLAVNKTSLIIAHRLSTITHADRIIVLGGGQILEQGNHHDLISRKGEYFKMWERQKEGHNESTNPST